MSLNFRARLRVDSLRLLLHRCDEEKHICCSILGTFELNDVWVAILKEMVLLTSFNNPLPSNLRQAFQMQMGQMPFLGRFERATNRHPAIISRMEGGRYPSANGRTKDFAISCMGSASSMRGPHIFLVSQPN